MADEFWTVFSANPYDVLVESGVGKRTWYDEQLRGQFKTKALLSKLAQWKANLGQHQTDTIVFSFKYAPEAQYGKHDRSDLMVDSMGNNVWRLQVQTEPHHVKKTYRKNDPLILYWNKNQSFWGAKQVMAELGQMLIQQQERMALVALTEWFKNGWSTAKVKNHSSIGELTADDADVFSLDDVKDWEEIMEYRPVATRDDGGQTAQAVMFTKAAMNTIVVSDFTPVAQYTTFQPWVENEVGAWSKSRFVVTPRLVLPNYGAVSTEANIDQPVKTGDGGVAIENVVDVSSTNKIHCATLVDADSNPLFAVGDFVTIHTHKLTDGRPDFSGYRVFFREVAFIDTSANTIAFTEPLSSDMDQDLGGGVYGYITKGLHVHLALGLNPNLQPDMLPLANGFSMKPQLNTPPDVSDTQLVYRAVLTYYSKIQPFHTRNLMLTAYSGKAAFTPYGPRWIG